MQNVVVSNKYSCIIVHGWGGHAIASFTSPIDSHVWPRDSLPVYLPEMRIWTYGYGSRLTDSDVLEDPYTYSEDLKNHLRLLLKKTNVSLRSD